MTDRPIYIPAALIPALLDGRKTQHRVPLKPQPDNPRIAGAAQMPDGRWAWLDGWDGSPMGEAAIAHAPGDRLWVREAFTLTQFDKAVYRADARDQDGDRWTSIAPGDPRKEVLWKSPIHMPRRFSRITLTVTDVRVQRVQDISDDDAVAEGLIPADAGGVSCWRGAEAFPVTPSPGVAYRDLWNTIHGPDAWDRNDWVYALTFAVEKRSIDQ